MDNCKCARSSSPGLRELALLKIEEGCNHDQSSESRKANRMTQSNKAYSRLGTSA